MTLFAKLRRSVAMFICPELGPQPHRAGYNGTAKPMERAALDAAYAARTPEERGFISAEEAQAHDRARKEWIEAEKSRLKELGEGVGEVPRGKVVVERVLVPRQAVGQFSGTAQDIAGDRRVERAQADNKDRQELLQNTAFGSGVSQDLHLFGGHGAGHQSSPSVDACFDASPSSGGCE